MVNVTRVMIGNRALAIAAPAAAATVFLLTLRDAGGLMVGYFGITMATAFLILSLMLENSVWLMWVFPWFIPVEVTVATLVAIYGLTFAAAW
jgi:hypothetical protein